MRRLVVGVDGSDPSVAALQWVVRLAREVGARVDVVTVMAPMPLAAPFGVGWEVADEAMEQAGRAQEHALSQVDTEGVEVTASIQGGQAAQVLLGAAEGADLLAIGTHGYGAIESALLGSISRQVVTHAVGPTVVVPSDPGAIGRIVVGIDGSEEALHALRWAGGLARDVGAEVEVVAAYQYTPVTVGSPWVAPVPVVGSHEMRDAANAVLDDAVSKADCGEVVVERTVAEGPAPARLRDRAGDADLLVVGSRGHGGFAGLLLGSVSRSCLTHATRPTLVVPSH